MVTLREQLGVGGWRRHQVGDWGWDVACAKSSFMTVPYRVGFRCKELCHKRKEGAGEGWASELTSGTQGPVRGVLGAMESGG